MVNIATCENCHFETDVVYAPYTNEQGQEYFYCHYCFATARDQRIRERGGLLPKDDKNEEIITKLEEDIKKLKERSQIDHEEFEKALDKAEEWHQRQLGEKDKELAERDKRISRLESLLKDKEIAELRREVNELSKKVSELAVHQAQEQQSQIEIPPKK